MRREIIAQAIAITTAGDPLIYPYRIASWLISQGHSSFFLMAEIRAYLGGAPEDIDPDIAGPIGSIIGSEKTTDSISRKRTKQ